MKMHAYEKEHILRLRRHLAECTVLLKSNGDFPLDAPCRIAAYGGGVRHTIKGGTGSGEVNSHFFVTVEQALKARGFTITTEGWLNDYDEVIADARAEFKREIKRRAKEKHSLAMYEGMGAVMPEPEYELPTDAEGDAAIYVLARISGEGSDRQFVKGDFLLTDTEVRDILDIAARYPKFMLILNTGGPVDLTPVLEVPNILLLSQLGVDTGLAAADILLGRMNPSGRLTTTWAAPSSYPSIGEFGDIDEARYKEGIYVGYRYFDSVNSDPLFPFGYGLSYTSFEIGNESILLDGEMVSVTCEVENTGVYPGKEVLQLYVSKPEGKLDQPRQVLTGFEKTEELAPGEMAEAEIAFTMSELASYDEGSASWILEKGDYILRLGTSSRETTPIGALRLEENVTVSKLRNLLGKPDFTDWKPADGIGSKEPEATAEAAGETVEAGAAEAAEASTVEGEPAAVELDEALLQEEEGLEIILVDASQIPRSEVLYEEAEERAAEPYLESLSDEELAYLVIGRFDPKAGMLSIIGNAGQQVAGAAGETTDALAYDGVGALIMADGPAGLRLTREYVIDKKGKVRGLGSPLPEGMVEFMPGPAAFFMKHVGMRKPKTGEELYDQYCTAVPIGTALAQSWNTHFAFLCGDIIGEEMERFGVDLWLAPALNIHRNVLCGRNFEYYSEDPLISGHMAAAITCGVQKHPGKGTTVKHFAANNQETNRMGCNSQVSERAMREIYLRGFEICVREAQPLALMTSYNLLNGVHTSESRELTTEILRKEWGFKGIVMTDWVVPQMMDQKAVYPVATADATIAAGGDLFMPGSKRDFETVLKALGEGHLSREDLLASAARVYRMIRKIKG